MLRQFFKPITFNTEEEFIKSFTTESKGTHYEEDKRYPKKTIDKLRYYGALVHHRYKLIYTYFGYTHSFLSTKQVIGSADSNLYYPEVRFWEGFSSVEYFALKLKDFYRIYGLRRADYVIFENHSLERRFKRLYNLSAKEKSTTILPSVSSKRAPFAKRELHPKFRVLILSRWQRNKNLSLLPELAKELQAEDVEFRLSLSLDNPDALAKEVKEKIERF